MSYRGPDVGNVTINGLPPASWALEIFLPPLVPSILGQAVAIFVCYWEFVVLFPSEVQIWQRLLRKPYRWQFAPTMTILMRYLLICYASAAAFTQYSTSMTDRACTAASTVFVICVIAINTSSILCMAWRSHAVAMGVIERHSIRWAVRAWIGFMLTATIAMVWYAFINAQFTGSWSSRAEHGVCVSDFAYKIDETDVVDSPEFWYYVVSILFDATCMIVICMSLKKLARRSTGFSKLIRQLVYHSLGYFLIIFLLFLLGIIWLRVQNAYWAANFIQMIQASIVIRILISEQKKAQRPHDTELPASYYAGYAMDSRDARATGAFGASTHGERYASDSRFGPHDSRTHGRSGIGRRSGQSGRLSGSSGRDDDDLEEGGSYDTKAGVKDSSDGQVSPTASPIALPALARQMPSPRAETAPGMGASSEIEMAPGAAAHGSGVIRARTPNRRQDSDYGGSTAIASDDGRSSSAATSSGAAHAYVHAPPVQRQHSTSRKPPPSVSGATGAAAAPPRSAAAQVPRTRTAQSEISSATTFATSNDRRSDDGADKYGTDQIVTLEALDR